MAKASRPRPARLAEKLKEIRSTLGFSQDQMLRALKLAERSNRSLISGFELGTKEPSLLTLLRYAQLVGVSTDVLIDDSTDLPKNLAS